MPALVKIEGIGETYADKLANARIGTTQALLKRGATRQGRKEIGRISGIDNKKILAWVNRADLFRIRGVGEEYSDLLEAAGVDTVVELANRNPDRLCERMVEVNDRRKLVRRTPSVTTVKTWIRLAKKLPRVVEY